MLLLLLLLLSVLGPGYGPLSEESRDLATTTHSRPAPSPPIGAECGAAGGQWGVRRVGNIRGLGSTGGYRVT